MADKALDRLRRYLKFDFALKLRKANYWLLAKAAACGMVISAGAGVLSLLLAGAMPWKAAGPALGIWWMGDSAGVLLAADREGEETFQKPGAAGGQLVEGQGAAAGLCQDGQQAAAGRGLQHLVAWADLGGEHGQGAELGRGGELVEGDLLLAAPSVGEAQLGQIGQQGDDLGRGVLQAADLRRQAADL